MPPTDAQVKPYKDEDVKKAMAAALKPELDLYIKASCALIRATEAHANFLKEWHKKNPDVNSPGEANTEYLNLLHTRDSLHWNGVVPAECALRKKAEEEYTKITGCPFEVSGGTMGHTTRSLEPQPRDSSEGQQSTQTLEPFDKSIDTRQPPQQRQGPKILEEIRAEAAKLAESLVEAENGKTPSRNPKNTEDVEIPRTPTNAPQVNRRR